MKRCILNHQINRLALESGLLKESLSVEGGSGHSSAVR